MNTDIHMIELPAMNYVRFYGFSENPEDIAIGDMLQWAEKNKYFKIKGGRCFGFNNPDPTPGSKKYGYEVWLTIPDGFSSQNLESKIFSGGKYAVASCSGKVQDAADFIPSAWKSLMEWLENSQNQMGKHQWLEEQLAEEGLSIADMYQQGKISLNLYMPIQ